MRKMLIVQLPCMSAVSKYNGWHSMSYYQEEKFNQIINQETDAREIAYTKINLKL